MCANTKFILFAEPEDGANDGHEGIATIVGVVRQQQEAFDDGGEILGVNVVDSSGLARICDGWRFDFGIVRPIVGVVVEESRL